MIRKVMTLALIAGSMSIAACNTVRGAAADVNSAANAVDNEPVIRGMGHSAFINGVDPCASS